MISYLPAQLVAVRLDNPMFGSGPATVVAHPQSVDEYNAMITDRDGARDPRMRLWRVGRGSSPIGSRVVTKLVCGTGLAHIVEVQTRKIGPSDLRPGLRIVCIDHPEWGEWTVLRHYAPSTWEIRGASGVRTLDAGEAHFWAEVVQS